MSNKYIVEAEAILRIDQDMQDLYPQDGLSWRDAKKALRAYYLNKARSLRDVTEKEYFNNDQS